MILMRTIFFSKKGGKKIQMVNDCNIMAASCEFYLYFYDNNDKKVLLLREIFNIFEQ